MSATPKSDLVENVTKHSANWLSNSEKRGTLHGTGFRGESAGGSGVGGDGLVGVHPVGSRNGPTHCVDTSAGM